MHVKQHQAQEYGKYARMEGKGGWARMWGRAWVVCTADILPVWVSHRLRLPSVSPMMTR